MNGTDTTEGAYIGSEMFKTHLPEFATKISTALDSHILTWRSLMSHDISTTATAAGYSGWSGCTSNSVWTDINCRLLSEVDVYGSSIWGNAWDVGESNRQLPGFAMNPELLIKLNPEDNSRRGAWWLCAVASSAYFADVGNDGLAYNYYASSAFGVVPKVLFG